MILVHLTTCALSFGAIAPVQTEHPFETDAHRIPEDPYGGTLFIDNATLHTAVGPAFVGDLWVKDGVIAGIGEELTPPGDVRVIDGEGLHVAPGAIDTHSHMAISRGINESTVSITADVDMTDGGHDDDPDPARFGQRHRRALGAPEAPRPRRDRRRAALRRRTPGHQVRPGREPQAFELGHPRRALPRHAPGRRGDLLPRL
ncbi:MAG: hypothetical protein ACYS26_03815 [Planctomycetota bacterium]|jgi:hypothetical protein